MSVADIQLVRREPWGRGSAALLIAAAAAAAAFGWTVAGHPLEAILAAALVPIALAAPLASFVLLVGMTVLLPFDALNALSFGGGAGVPGLLPVDVLLAVGLARFAWLALRGRVAVPATVLAATALLAVSVVQAAHGVAAGAAASDAGTEARCVVFGLGAFILAQPLLAGPRSRKRLYLSLLALGLALGLWGIAQVVLNVPYSSAGDIGVRPGIDAVASFGGGQLQGGLYAFPIAVVMAFAGLVSRPRRMEVRWLLAAVFVLNAVCVLLTYERSIWAAALIGCAAVVIRTGARAWRPAVQWLALGGAAVLALAVLSPGTAAVSVGRVTSVFSVQNDSSAQARTVESEAVLRAIEKSPVIGAGFGATLTWGGGNNAQFGVRTTNFTHEGYLWLAWKESVPVALLLAACLWLAALRRRRPHGDAALDAFRVGCHAALLASLVVCVVFPEFNALGVTSLLGLLTAGCVTRVVA
ncbi:MAG TPA: O-antigen ligase family protein [Solirubrobacteraceae bacterium]